MEFAWKEASESWRNLRISGRQDDGDDNGDFEERRSSKCRGHSDAKYVVEEQIVTREARPSRDTLSTR